MWVSVLDIDFREGLFMDFLAFQGLFMDIEAEVRRKSWSEGGWE